MPGNNVVRMKKRFQPNISYFLFLLVLLYLVVLVWNFFSREHVSIYEVSEAKITDDTPMTAYVYRKEEVVSAEADGYINYFIPERSRVAVGTVIYTLDEDGSLSDTLDDLKKETKGTEDIDVIRESLSDYMNGFSLSDYRKTSELHFDLTNSLLEKSRGSLYKKLKKQLSSAGDSKGYEKYKVAKSGVISYFTDGYESYSLKEIGANIFDKAGTSKPSQVADSGKVEEGDPVYKLVTGNDWSLIVETDDDYHKRLMGMDSVRVTMEKDGISFNASINLFDRDGRHFARLTTSRYMERYINDRFLSIRFDIKTAKGLKIPNMSILEKTFYPVSTDCVNSTGGQLHMMKLVRDSSGGQSTKTISPTSYFFEDDKCYVSGDGISMGDTVYGQDMTPYTITETKKKEGVYLVNEGFCEFRPIDIKYKNKEYTIIADNTKNGLATYDHIVVDPSKLNDDDFID